MKMLLVNFLNNLFKKKGFILIDANNQEHTIGKTNLEKPLIMKIHDKKFHYKLLFYPDLYFGEGYTDGKISFQNGNISDFLDLALQNLGREKTNTISEFINSIKGSYRYPVSYTHLTLPTICSV